MKKVCWPVKRLVEIEWDDASTSKFGWENISVYRTQEVVTCRSVGYLIRKDAKQVVIVQTQAGNQNDVMREIAIPRGMVKKIKWIRSGLK